jgi:acyl-CoA thioesterase
MNEARAPSESLTEMLQIVPGHDGLASARLESFWGAAAKGDLLARATLAGCAARGEAPSATQAIFLRPVPPDLALTFGCDLLSADRTRVGVREQGALVAEVQLRFGPANDGLTYPSAAPEPGLPAPEELPSEAEVAAREGWSQYAVGPIESRRLTPNLPVKGHEPAVWVHRAERWDDWWLVRTSSDVGVAGRCLSHREIFTRGGALVASAAWEAVLRTRSAGAR